MDMQDSAGGRPTKQLHCNEMEGCDNASITLRQCLSSPPLVVDPLTEEESNTAAS